MPLYMARHQLMVVTTRQLVRWRCRLLPNNWRRGCGSGAPRPLGSDTALGGILYNARWINGSHGTGHRHHRGTTLDLAHEAAFNLTRGCSCPSDGLMFMNSVWWAARLNPGLRWPDRMIGLHHGVVVHAGAETTGRDAAVMF